MIEKSEIYRRVMEKSSKRQASDGEEQETGKRRGRARVKRVMGKSVRDKRMIGKNNRQAGDGEEQETDRQMMGKSEIYWRVMGKSERDIQVTEKSERQVSD